jgi:hypothetical protein
MKVKNYLACNYELLFDTYSNWQGELDIWLVTNITHIKGKLNTYTQFKIYFKVLLLHKITLNCDLTSFKTFFPHSIVVLCSLLSKV